MTPIGSMCTSAANVILGAVMPAPQWAIGGGMTHVAHPRGSPNECVQMTRAEPSGVRRSLTGLGSPNMLGWFVGATRFGRTSCPQEGSLTETLGQRQDATSPYRSSFRIL